MILQYPYGNLFFLNNNNVKSKNQKIKDKQIAMRQQPYQTNSK